MYVCCVCAVPLEARREYQNPWNQSDRLLCAAMGRAGFWGGCELVTSLHWLHEKLSPELQWGEGKGQPCTEHPDLGGWISALILSSCLLTRWQTEGLVKGQGGFGSLYHPESQAASLPSAQAMS